MQDVNDAQHAAWTEHVKAFADRRNVLFTTLTNIVSRAIQSVVGSC
jgi:hypothetical protein